MAQERFDRLLEFLRRLNDAHIQHRLSSFRSESICVEVAVPGERWEVEFMEDGTVQVERFRSVGEIEDDAALARLFRDFSG